MIAEYQGIKYKVKAQYTPETVLLKDVDQGFFKNTRMVNVIQESEDGDIGLVKYRHRGYCKVKYKPQKNYWIEIE